MESESESDVEQIYVLVHDFCCWEDMVVCHTQEEAIPLSMQNPGGRVEIFAKKRGSLDGSYYPTYKYWKRGCYVDNTKPVRPASLGIANETKK